VESCSAIVLAGGRATRLGGSNKAALEIGGQRLIDRVVQALRPLSDQILIVGHLVQPLDDECVRVIPDAIPGGSSMVGLYSGLLAARHDISLVVACDMPFLSTPVLRKIVQCVAGHDAAVPRINGYLEAIHAAYRRSCLPVIEDALKRGNYKIIDFYQDIDMVEVDEAELRKLEPNLHTFLNVNTPADLDTAKSLASQL
jgi:molybdopterin-guanine dinucleotide biosynthesis protein A